LKVLELEQMKLFSELLAKLKGTREEGGTLLDRTIVMFGSNLGNASSHDKEHAYHRRRGVSGTDSILPSIPARIRRSRISTCSFSAARRRREFLRFQHRNYSGLRPCVTAWKGFEQLCLSRMGCQRP